MTPLMACMADAAVCRLRDRGLLAGEDLGRRETPFGVSDPIVRVDDVEAPFYLVVMCDEQGRQICPGSVNYRADFYALKDLGVQCVLGVSACGSITHNFSVGDIVLVSDMIDRTTRRPQTFFEHCGAGVVRQFPVFCPSLRRAMGDCLDGMGCGHHAESTLVVTEGPRLETPAEIRWLAAAGGELVGHRFAPEAFLAKELEMCFAGLAYVANYAETGSRYRPFSASDLFGGLTTSTESERLERTTEVIAGLIVQVSRYGRVHPATCECDRTMRHAVEKFDLPSDWRRWFGPGRSTPAGRYEDNRPKSTIAPVEKTS